MDYCPAYFEVNADISHYNFRQITAGGWLARILARVGHTHQRMARQLGDLSAEVEDPAADWDAKVSQPVVWFRPENSEELR
jgi:hypothetical protein